MWIFPVSHIGKIVTLTNINLSKFERINTTSEEILKFFGVLILLTRYESGSHRQLRYTTSKNKYIAASDFSRIIPRHRFDVIRSSIRFSNFPLNESYEENRRALVDDFVKVINDHRKDFVHPSDLICVDESMSRWYGPGGDWINVGLLT